jgi:hypothetical protein
MCHFRLMDNAAGGSPPAATSDSDPGSTACRRTVYAVSAKSVRDRWSVSLPGTARSRPSHRFVLEIASSYSPGGRAGDITQHPLPEFTEETRQ